MYGITKHCKTMTLIDINVIVLRKFVIPACWYIRFSPTVTLIDISMWYYKKQNSYGLTKNTIVMVLLKTQ